jgi:cysteinyl-tRNA synthetase
MTVARGAAMPLIAPALAHSLRRIAGVSAVALAYVVVAAALSPQGLTARPLETETSALADQRPPAPQPAVRPRRDEPAALAAASGAERLRRVNAARSWGYQLSGLAVAAAQRSPYDLLVIDATTGHAADRPFRADEIEALKRKPDGSRRLVVSYLSIGEAEDYRPDYFSKEYLEEDAPDWLMAENPQWKGNRVIRFCREGWQQTILGDENGRNVYNSLDPSPLYRLIEMGLDGVYLDRVDVYHEVAKECPDARARMIEFVARLAAHARKKNPHFLVILQNAEELLASPQMINAIDAVAKEDLFYGVDHTEKANSAALVADSVANLKRAKAASRPVFVVDYLRDRGRIADAKRRIEAQGFIPYIAPRDLGALWLPGVNF